jgi:uncharacterized protein (TIGR02246 family)
MKTRAAMAMLWLLTLGNPAPSQPPTTAGQVVIRGSVADPITEMRNVWAKAFEDRDLNAMLSLYADNAAVLPPSGEFVTGQEKITAFFEQIFDSALGLTIRLDSQRSGSSGDLGYDAGVYEETIRRSDGGLLAVGSTRETIRHGAYMVVARRTAGKWLIVQQALTEVPQTAAR